MRTTRASATTWPLQATGVAVAAGLVVTLVARALVRDGGDPRVGVAAALIVLTLVPAGIVLVLAGGRGRPAPSDLGLRRPPLRRAVALTVTAWIAVFVLSAVWVTALGLEDDAPNLVDRLAGKNGALNGVLIVILAAVATPLAEELLFRACLFRALAERWGVWPGALASSAVFAAFHLGWTPDGLLPVVLLFGLACCLLYHGTGSLYAPLALHALFNCFGVAAGLGWTWQAPLAIALSIVATCAVAGVVAGRLADRSLRNQWT